MIEYSIKQHLGVKTASSLVTCDGCGSGYRWGPAPFNHVLKGDILRGKLKREGWSIKKKHLCQSCAAQNKSGSGGTSANSGSPKRGGTAHRAYRNPL
jgi:hypothetical protein